MLHIIGLIPYVVPILLLPYFILVQFRSFILKNSSSNRRLILTNSSGDYSLSPPTFLAYFHPNCFSGGGGERVLFVGIQEIQRKHRHIIQVIYTSSDKSASELVQKVNEQFGIQLNEGTLKLVNLKYAKYLKANWYPILTMVFQSLASALVVLEALYRFNPDYFFDTVGVAFTYPVVNFISDAKILAYVHYPTISTDMIDRVETTGSFSWYRRLKWGYYKLFALAYSYVGSFTSLVMVNSTWTYNHIISLWSTAKPHIVYPPCQLPQIKPNLDSKRLEIISLAQFRPEKDHPLQIKIIDALLKKRPDLKQLIKLNMVGSVRNEDDKNLVNDLHQSIQSHHLEDNIELICNASFEQVQSLLKSAIIGLHTMQQEHFGIAVVELLANGCIPIAHDSAGPKLDILKGCSTQGDNDLCGALATTIDQYVDAIIKLVDLYQKDKMTYQTRIEKNFEYAADKFSNTKFLKEYTGHIEKVLGI